MKDVKDTKKKQIKIRTGVVVSAKMDKSVVVSVERLTRHPIFRKYVRKRSKLYAHDKDNQCQEGDNAGSWHPKNDRWASSGGRVYTTALGALCLEVYYRYSQALNSFGVAPDLVDLFLQ